MPISPRRSKALLTLFAALAYAVPACSLADDDHAISQEEEELRRRRRKDAGADSRGAPPPSSTADGGATPAPTSTSPTPAPTTTGTPPSTPPSTNTRWLPKPGTTWQWQLSGTGALDTSLDVMAYDLDLFETSQATIDQLHAAGRKVICYFDTAYEPGRPDSALLAPYRGNAMKGWPGQYWLDIRPQAVVDVMKARIAMAQQHKCDAVEADDVDSASNNPGTGVTQADQRTFIKLLAAEAHARGMSFALKNDLEDVPALINDVDFAINEECFQYNECDALTPFITADKAVLHVEYTSGSLATKGATICPKANALNFDTLIKHLDLDAARYACR